MYSERIAMDHYHQEAAHPGMMMTQGMQGDQPLATPLQPQTVVLKDGETVATMYPIPSVPQLLPSGLLSFLLDEFNMEVEKGDSFPYYETLTMEEFQDVWFNRDGHICIMVLGEIPELDYSIEDIYPADASRSKSSSSATSNYKTGRAQEGSNAKSEEYMKRKGQRKFDLDVHWDRQCLGIFQLQPAYPGRSSHVVTGTFLVNAGIRGKGIGKTLMETFVEWSKKLGFTSCCFPLIYETNVGIRCILEGLNFRRVGKLPEAGILKGYDVPVDSFIYAKEFTHIKKSIDLLRDPEKNHEIAKYERLRYYMETGEYPLHCDRNEKARLRVTAKNHTLLNGKLMTKDREVVYNPETQRQIALDTHQVLHEGINKVTSRIARKYHWKGIKNTVSEVIAQCQKCKMRYPDENGIIVKPGGAPVPQAHMLPSLMINATDLTQKNTAPLERLANNETQDPSEVPTPADADMGIPRKRTNSEVENYGHVAVQQPTNCHRGSLGNKDMTYATSGINPNASTSNTFDKFISEELNRKRAHYIDAATKVLVDMNDSGNNNDNNTEKRGSGDHVMTDAMLNLEDNVMAALEIVQKEQQEQQRTAEEHEDQLRRQRENEQFLLSFNFDAEYHEDEDEDYNDDVGEEEEEEDDEDDEEEVEDEYENASRDSNGIDQDDIRALIDDKHNANFESDSGFIAERRRMLQEIQEIAIENTVDDDNNNDLTESTPRG